MFPISFKNRADKERQYRLYKQSIAKNLVFDKIKQERYEQALWASDLITSTEKPRVETTETGSQAVVETSTQDSQTVIDDEPMVAITRAGVEKTASTPSEVIKPAADIRVKSDLLDVVSTKFHIKIKKLFKDNKYLVAQKINPVQLNGQLDKQVYFGAGGHLYDNGSHKLTRTDLMRFNFEASYNRVLSKLAKIYSDDNLKVAASSEGQVLRRVLENELRRKVVQDEIRESGEKFKIGSKRYPFNLETLNEHVKTTNQLKKMQIQLNTIRGNAELRDRPMSRSDLDTPPTSRSKAVDPDFEEKPRAMSLQSTMDVGQGLRGRGLSKSQKNEVLRQELLKLQGQYHGLGNSNKKNRRELRLLSRMI